VDGPGEEAELGRHQHEERLETDLRVRVVALAPGWNARGPVGDMGRGKRERRRAAADRPPERVAGPWRVSRAVALGAAVALAALAVAAGAWWLQSGRRVSVPWGGGFPPSRPPASYVGHAACGQCHRQAEQNWRGSHHDLAMQPATDASVAGDFNNARFTYAGVTSTFFRRDGKFVVRTDGPDGMLHDYDVTYAFGTSPLQQYLIEFP